MTFQVEQHVSPVSSSFGSDPRTERLRNIANFFQTKYNFRTAARESVKSLSTWIDQDQSGDYNHDAKTAQVEITSKKKRGQLAGLHDEPAEAKLKKQKTNTYQFGRRHGQSLPFTFEFKTDAGRTLLKKLSQFPGEKASQFGSSDHSVSWWSTSGHSFDTNDTSQSFQPYSLRKPPRSHFGRPSPHLDNSANQTVPGVEEVTLGHPAARGCKGCLELGIRCTLLKEGYTYPCADCVEDDIECELILPLSKKRPCENCRRRKIVCSYREGGNHSGPCQQCMESTLKCLAGPLSGRTRTGPCLDQDLSSIQRFVPTAQRPFITCTQCRQAKRWCSLKSKDQEAPCKHCKTTGIDCTFQRLLDKPNKKRKLSAKRAGRLKQIQDPIVSAGIPGTKTIRTRYAHPISFNYVPAEDNEDGSVPCDWCASLAFAVLGRDELEVEVIDYGAGQGYIEVSGGHTGRGQRPSRMCPDCTMKRLQISACKTHDIQSIQGLDPDDFDFDAAIACLLQDNQHDAGSPPHKYCSVCPGPAFLECCKSNTFGMGSEDENFEASGAPGCGLLLCETCAVSLVEEHDGSLESLVAALEIDGGQFGTRADVKFLLESGELLQRITAGG